MVLATVATSSKLVPVRIHVSKQGNNPQPRFSKRWRWRTFSQSISLYLSILQRIMSHPQPDNWQLFVLLTWLLLMIFCPLVSINFYLMPMSGTHNKYFGTHYKVLPSTLFVGLVGSLACWLGWSSLSTSIKLKIQKKCKWRDFIIRISDIPGGTIYYECSSARKQTTVRYSRTSKSSIPCIFILIRVQNMRQFQIVAWRTFRVQHNTHSNIRVGAPPLLLFLVNINATIA